MAQYAFVFLPKAAVLLNALKTFNDRRYLSIFLFGISSGFPWIMIGSVLSAWLKDEGLSRSAIGLFGIIFATYSFNFLWSPLVDKIKPPLLGQRRGWIFADKLINDRFLVDELNNCVNFLEGLGHCPLDCVGIRP